MTNIDAKASSIKSTLTQVAHGTNAARNFGKTLQSAFQAGVCDKEHVAELMGVQPKQLYAAAQSLKPTEVRKLCQKLI